MSPRLAWSLTGSRCFPRASGDEPDSSDDLPQLLLFSPRERG